MLLGVGLGYQPAAFAMFVQRAAGQARTVMVSGQETGWYAVLEDPRMPVTSTLLDQAHKALDRKLCMKGSIIPKGVNGRFCEAWHIYTTWYPISAVLSSGGFP